MRRALRLSRDCGGMRIPILSIATPKHANTPCRYRREFQSLILRLQVENDIFRNTCELLLNGLARDNEMTELLEYIGYGHLSIRVEVHGGLMTGC